MKAIRFWEDTIGVWENDEHEIVGVVNMGNRSGGWWGRAVKVPGTCE